MPTFTEADAAALYDVLSPWDPARFAADRFYTSLVMDARSVLDVGCGTGAMLRHARRSGHGGRLTGIDPSAPALDRARPDEDIEWHLLRADQAYWEGEFELAVMASHAFQCLTGDEELRNSLRAVRRALRPTGCFAFETRHPAARAWENWSPEHAVEVSDGSGRKLRVAHEVEEVTADLVTFTTTTVDVDRADSRPLHTDRSKLRFLEEERLDAFLEGAGFEVIARHGDWDRTPVGPESTEIITVARPVRA